MFHTTFELDKTGLREAGEAITRGLKHLVETSVTEAGEIARDVARQGNFKDRTGELRRTIYTKPLGWSGETFWALIHAPARGVNGYYALFVEEDTKAHDIWPKAAHGFTGPLRSGQTRRASGRGPHEHIVGRGQALRWVDAGEEHFARMVHHPGTQGRHFMADGAHTAEIWLRARIQNGFAGLQAVLN